MTIHQLASWALSLPIGHHVIINGDAMCAVVYSATRAVAVIDLL